ncbi:MAG: hypothetical protein JRJ68_03685 [Deltaproteobacteria bacterium]|nr:hypothetical protein [Deltaproteobacteria bacterium]
MTQTQALEDKSQLSSPAQTSFENFGSTLHFKIKDYFDLQAILKLDEALWIATTAPFSTLRIDPVFLNLLDSDGDGRLRAEEIKDGIRFLQRNLVDYSGVRENNLNLSLAAVNTETDLGARIHSSALKVLSRLNTTPESVTLNQVRTVKKEVLEGGLDQAGIVLVEAAGTSETYDYIKDIIRTVGGRQHPNGQEGVDTNCLNDFMKECRHYIDWQLEAGEINGDAATRTLPLGKKTADGYALFHSLSRKLIQYFLLCDIKRLNPQLLTRALDMPEGNPALNLMNIEEAEKYLENAPLSLLGGEGTLNLSGEINPYFREKMKELTEKVIKPLLGDQVESINRQSFHKLQKIFRPFTRWTDRMPEVSVDILASETVQEYLTNPSYRHVLEELIGKSHKTAFILDNLKELERLLLYRAYMLPLANSFVSFPKLYLPEERALFEEGTLIMDGRHFTLAIRVEDRKHHIAISKGSNIFIIYCELFGADGEKNCEIAVPVTSGNRGNIHLSKWGIFNDINGNELHAKVVDIVENPISISEAMVEPFVRISRAFFSRLEDFSSKAEEQLFNNDLKSKDKKKKDGASAGLLAGGGFAVAAIGSSFAFITKTLASLHIKTVIYALLILAALIAIPAGIAAYYKLTRRDLSTILEGAGWGINSRMKLTKKQAACFTYRPDRS